MLQTSELSGQTASPGASGLVFGDDTERVHEVFVALQGDFSGTVPSREFRHVFRANVLEELRRRATVQSPVRVLEVGCGDGAWAQEIHEAFAGQEGQIQYLGIDITEQSIEHGRRRLAGHSTARFMLADCESFEPKTTFDVILCIEIMCHVKRDRDRDWLKRFYQWLDPGGTVIFIDKDRYSRHAMRVYWDNFLRRFLPVSLLPRRYYFPERYRDLIKVLYYPSFRSLRNLGSELGYVVRPPCCHGRFRAQLLDKPTVNRNEDEMGH